MWNLSFRYFVLKAWKESKNYRKTQCWYTVSFFIGWSRKHVSSHTVFLVSLQIILYTIFYRNYIFQKVQSKFWADLYCNNVLLIENSALTMSQISATLLYVFIILEIFYFYLILVVIWPGRLLRNLYESAVLK